MKTVRYTAISIVTLMLLSILASFGAVIAENDSIEVVLNDEPVKKEATSPGHPVFAEYMGAHWCGPCHTASANLHSLYGTNGGRYKSEDFTYISFWESPTTGNPNLSPIKKITHPGSTRIWRRYSSGGLWRCRPRNILHIRRTKL